MDETDETGDACGSDSYRESHMHTEMDTIDAGPHRVLPITEWFGENSSVPWVRSMNVAFEEMREHTTAKEMQIKHLENEVKRITLESNSLKKNVTTLQTEVKYKEGLCVEYATKDLHVKWEIEKIQTQLKERDTTIKRLETEVVQRKKQLMSRDTTVKKMEAEVIEKKEQLMARDTPVKKLEAEVIEKKEQLMSSLEEERTEKERLKKELTKRTSELDNLQSQRDKSYMDIQKCKDNYQQENNTLKEEIENLNKDIEHLKTYTKAQQKKIETMRTVIGKNNKKFRKLRENYFEEQQGWAKCQIEFEQRGWAKCQIEFEQSERDNLQSEKDKRLSKLPGANLTYNNPNIADLSNKSRPTKLAEGFAELYDNQWTDAYEVVKYETDEQRTNYLLKLLQNVNQLCVDSAKEHTQLVKQSLSSLTLRVPSTTTPHINVNDTENTVSKTADVSANSTISKKKVLESNFDMLNNELKKTISDVKKYFEKELTPQFQKACVEIVVAEHLIDTKQHKEVVDYIEKCVEICWSMQKHEPAVYVDFQQLDGEVPFNTDKHKPYTKSGKHVDYIVWPALYLHEGGPLLSKSVAEGKL